MPTEVIDLLSSSPAAPPPPTFSSTRTHTAPSRALDYGALDETVKPSSKAALSSRVPNKPLTTAKRTNSTYTQQHNDFLFLSDDFDTTGDLDGNVAKKAKISTSSVGIKKRQDNGFKRIVSAAVVSENRENISPTTLKRCNSIVDPIEHSSSPYQFPPSKAVNRPTDYSDPFKSSPKKPARNTKSSLLGSASDPFNSSPIREIEGHKPPTHSKSKYHTLDDPFDSPKGKKATKLPIVIDLSDDDENLLRKFQPKKSKQNGAWDPISSSMPETRTGSNTLGGLDSDDLPDLGDIDFSRFQSRGSFSLSPSPPPKKSKATTKSAATKKPVEPKKTNEEKEEEKRRKAEAREAEKKRKLVEKEQVKEQCAIEKQKEKALAEVNKLKTDRKVAAPEMVVDLPNTLSVTIKTQVEKLLADMDVQFEYQDNRVDDVVKWRRKVTSEYNDGLGHWEPVPMRIQAEEHVMVLVQAADFVKLVLGSEGQDLEAHILKMKTSFSNNTLIYLIEGLTPWLRKNKNALNRRFVSAVRSLDPNPDSAPSSQSQSRRRNNAAQQEYIDEDIIEDALLSLQVIHGALIHHTNAAIETAQWVAAFTQHISTIPYRRARDAAADAGFCMEAGQVRTGEDARDTYVRMLQEVTRVTAPIAYGIAARYGTVAELVCGLEERGPLALEDCRKCANRDGAFTDRVVGPAISKRIYKIFTSRDPGSMDV